MDADTLHDRLWDAITEERVDLETLYLAHRAVDLHPNDADLWIVYGHAIMYAADSGVGFRGQYRRVECYRRATEVDPACAEAWVEYGIYLERLSRYEAAAEALERAIGISPTSEAYVALAVVESQRGNQERALELLDRSEGLPDRRDWDVQTAQEIRAGEWAPEPPEAETSEEQADHSGDEATPSRFETEESHVKLLSIICRAETVSQDSLTSAAEAVEEFPDSGRLWWLYAKLLGTARAHGLDLGEETLSRAVWCYAHKRAAELMPDEPRPWSDYGLALTISGAFEPARGAFERAIELSPDPFVIAQLARVLANLGDRAGARLQANRAIELDPNNPVIEKMATSVLAGEWD